MKLLHSTREVVVPEGLSLEVKARQVRVKGPRGEHITSQWPTLALLWAAMEDSNTALGTRGGCLGCWCTQVGDEYPEGMDGCLGRVALQQVQAQQQTALQQCQADAY